MATGEKAVPGVSAQTWNASLYDDKHAFVWKHGAALIELLSPQPGEHILDLGCGTGHLTAQIAARRATVVGLDSSAAMIDQARAAYPQLHFQLSDARDFTFSEPFDAVFSNAVLHWITEPERVIASVARALKPGGRFVLEFGGKGNIQWIAAAVEHATGALGLAVQGAPWFYPSLAEYAALLERGGLEVTFATLFERPTPLDGQDGMRHWVDMFRAAVVKQVPLERREEFYRHIEEELRPRLYRDGVWYADYRRLRCQAVKPARERVLF